GYVKSGEAKTHALNTASKNYMFGCLCHSIVYDNP
ncbi:unnamed protein product, partial [marine sediment metagenome]